MGKSLQTTGLLLVCLLSVSHVITVAGKLETYKHLHEIAASESEVESASSLEQAPKPTDVIEFAKNSLDFYIQIQEAKELAQLAQRIAALKSLSAYLGVAGALVGFIFSFFGGSGPDPEILKLQEMIRETQTLITLGNQEILNAIRKLNSQDAQRSASQSINILDVLVRKHMIEKIEYQYGSYDVLPCGPLMTLCNNAFVDLSNRMDDILAASFEESPRGDKNRVKLVADNLMMLIANSYYSLTWLNAKQYNTSNPNQPIDQNNLDQVRQVSQAQFLKHYYDNRAVAAYERWTSTKKFQTCRLCTTCGGDYPNYGGEGLKQGDWGHWLRYREQCSAQLTSVSGPPQLCCSADEPPCQYCKSCGGDYPHQVGRKYNRDDWGPYQTKQDQCSGNFGTSWDEFNICCRQKKQCKLCGGNCAGNYLQVGKVERIDDWGIWGAYDEASCNADNQGAINTDRSADVSLCCLDYTTQ